MLPALLCAVVLAPIFGLMVPERWRRETLLAVNLAGLTILDERLPVLALVVAGGVYVSVRAIGSGRVRSPRWIVAPGLAALVALFVLNKTAGTGGLLPSQEGLVLLGVSYLVLKASAALIDAARGSLVGARFVDILAWIVFLPTYTSGPIEGLNHFRNQVPKPTLQRGFAGLERILFGLVKTMLLSHYLGAWSSPILAEPAAHTAPEMMAAVYMTTLRFYFDFSGYSDIAIGVAALFGIQIQENFDNPLIRRNLTQLWQRWHMTLTTWLRRYLFVPLSRRLLKAGGHAMEIAALGIAQTVTMTFCGLWHGLGWNFLLWGALQAAGMIWVANLARPLGKRFVPAPIRTFWRETKLGYALSTFLTFNYFAFTNILFFTGVEGAGTFFQALVGAS